MRKKGHHEEHEEHANHEAWVIPYADMLTLLMAMFLVLWAIGQVDTNKAKAVSTGFADEFGLSMSPGAGSGGSGVLEGVAKPDDPDPVGFKNKVDKTMQIAAQREQAQAAEKVQLEQAQQQIEAASAAAGLGGSLKFKMEGRGLVVSIVAEGVLFDAGSAEIKPEGRIILDDISKTLAALPNQLSIEGHTDTSPISTGQFPSNWELSTSRASTVLRYLASQHNIGQKRLQAAGYADQRPVAPNDTDTGRAQNRRVDIAVLSENPTTIADEAAGQPVEPAPAETPGA